MLQREQGLKECGASYALDFHTNRMTLRKYNGSSPYIFNSSPILLFT